MADVSRFPEGLLTVGTLLEAKPIGTLRVDELTNFLNKSISFPAVGWVVIDAAAPGTFTSATTAVSATTAAMGTVTVYQASAVDVTITITSADVTQGREFIFKDTSGSASAGMPITVDTQGGETIDGEPSATIIAPFGSISLYVDGGNLFSK